MTTPKLFTVYALYLSDTENANQIKYFGSTSDFAKRISYHKSRLSSNKHSNSLLQQAFNESAVPALFCEIVQTFTCKKLASKLEAELIATHNCFNKNKVTLSQPKPVYQPRQHTPAYVLLIENKDGTHSWKIFDQINLATVFFQSPHSAIKYACDRAKFKDQVLRKFDSIVLAEKYVDFLFGDNSKMSSSPLV